MGDKKPAGLKSLCGIFVAREGQGLRAGRKIGNLISGLMEGQFDCAGFGDYEAMRLPLR